jgi:hypothetical protein
MFGAQDLISYTKLVLGVFVLHVGLSMASPLMKSPVYDEICTSAGVTQQLVKPDILAAQGESAQHQHGLDCPVCSPFFNAPPPALGTLYKTAALAAQRVYRFQAPLATSRQATPPLPARGPPSI